jgi:hypothetical protein
VTPTLSALLELVSSRSTEDRFPHRDELHGLLDPFRALTDQETTRLALAAAIRKSGRIGAQVAAESLAYLARHDSLSLLLGIIEDEILPLYQRAGAAVALSMLCDEIPNLASENEKTLCAILSMADILATSEGDNGRGFKVIADTYLAGSDEARFHFVDALNDLAGQHQLDVAPALMFLVSVEANERNRHHLLERIAAGRSQRAANLLATFAKKTEKPGDAKIARKHLHFLRSRGIEGQVEIEFENARAYSTGVDGDACFALNVVVPRAPTFNFVQLIFHATSGIRDCFVQSNLSARSIESIQEEIRDNVGSLWAELPLNVAIQIIKDLGFDREKVRDKAEFDAVSRLIAPLLAGATKVSPEPEVSPGSMTSGEITRILEHEGFEYWFFEASEATIKPSIEALKTKPESKKSLLAEVAKVQKRLTQTNEPHRLSAMLRHQSLVLAHADRASQPLAELCRRASHEVQTPKSKFIEALILRSLLMALQHDDEDLAIHDAERWSEARDHLRGSRGNIESPRKSDMAALDLSACVHVAINSINRRLPSSERVSLTAIESAALDIGRLLSDRYGRDPNYDLDLLDSEIATALASHKLFAPSKNTTDAQFIASEVQIFLDAQCFGTCAHACLEDADGDARAAYHAKEFPWLIPAGQLRSKYRGD